MPRRWWRKTTAGFDPAAMEEALPGIGAVPWARLRSGAGDTAVRLPQLLVALASSTDGDDIRAIRADLDEHLAPDGLLFEATPYAVPFLVGLAQCEERPDTADTAQLILESIAYGEPHTIELTAGNTGLFRRVGEELSKLTEILYRQADSTDLASRAQAIVMLAPIDGRSPRFRRLLTALSGTRQPQQLVEAVREAEEYLADVAGGDRPALPTGPDDHA